MADELQSKTRNVSKQLSTEDAAVNEIAKQVKQINLSVQLLFKNAFNRIHINCKLLYRLMLGLLQNEL